MNTQIIEDYVSFETAKLLKEKGFDLHDTKELYVAYKDGYCVINNPRTKHYPTDEFPKATHQMTLKWLREVHNICIVIQPYDSYYKERYEFEINKKNNNDFTWEWISDIENTVFDTYEDAVEAAIKYCLTNLI